MAKESSGEPRLKVPCLATDRVTKTAAFAAPRGTDHGCTRVHDQAAGVRGAALQDPMNDSVFLALPAQTQAALAGISAAVEGVFPTEVRSWEIDVEALSEEAAASSLVNEVSDWVGASKACLYCFECRSTGIDLAKVERAFAKAKARKAHKRAYPHLNAQGTCFYVGSSRSLATRFRDHLGFGAKGTYALQLVHWAPPLSLLLEFVCARYAEDTPREVIQALEDTLWEASRPMFGRKGGL